MDRSEEMLKVLSDGFIEKITKENRKDGIYVFYDGKFLTKCDKPIQYFFKDRYVGESITKEIFQDFLKNFDSYVIDVSPEIACSLIVAVSYKDISE